MARILRGGHSVRIKKSVIESQYEKNDPFPERHSRSRDSRCCASTSLCRRGYSPLTLKDSDAPVLKAKPTVLTGIVGYEINPNVAVEGLLGLGLNKSSVTVGGTSTNIDAKISTSYGIFVKPKVMVSNEVELFARLGYASSKLKLSTSGASRSETESSFAYGLGGNYYLNKQTYLTASYMSLYSKDGVKATGLSIGVGYKF
jgi:opacity protein-like surface antigen